MKKRQPPTTLPFMTRARYAAAMISTGMLNLGAFGVFFRSVCSPGFHCHGCPWATAACPIGAMAFGSAMWTFPVYAAGFVLAVGALIGRAACAFLCPFGLLQDLLYKIPTPKISLPGWIRYFKYAALILLVFLLPALVGFRQYGYVLIKDTQVAPALGETSMALVTVHNPSPECVSAPQIDIVYYNPETQKELHRTSRTFQEVTLQPDMTENLAAFDLPPLPDGAKAMAVSPQSRVRQDPWFNLYYCKVCPAGTLTATLPAMFNGMDLDAWEILGQTWLRLSILAVFLLFMVISSRPFCRSFCPLGACYGLCSRFAVSGVKVDENACTGCGLCNNVCPTELDVLNEAGGSECIACGDCIAACPNNAIHRRFGLR